MLLRAEGRKERRAFFLRRGELQVRLEHKKWIDRVLWKCKSIGLAPYPPLSTKVPPHAKSEGVCLLTEGACDVSDGLSPPCSCRVLTLLSVLMSPTAALH